MNRRLLLRGVLVAAAALERGAHAQCEVDALPGQGHCPLYQTVALHGERALVSGAYVYERADGRWLETARLVPPGHPSDEPFGTGVALSENVAAVASEWEGGGVHVFELRGGAWTHVARLKPTAQADVYRHAGLGLMSDVLVVGDVLDDTLGTDAGAVHVYERVGGEWRHSAKLFASGGGAGHMFGYDVDVDGSTLIASSAEDDGVVRWFERTPTGWLETALVRGEHWLEQFGYSVALSSDRAVVGTYHLGGYIGGAVVLRREGHQWVLEDELEPCAPTAGDRFGCEVDIHGNRAVVGSDGIFAAVGRAHLFEERAGNWEQIAVLLPVGPGWAPPTFGASVSVHGPYAATGTPAGHYVYGQFGCATALEYCTATTNSTSEIARIHYGGSLSVSRNEFELRASFCPSGEIGFFFYGSTPAQVPFSHGFLCIAPGSGVFRFAAQVTEPLVTRRPVDFTAPPAGSGAGRIAAGSTWYFQFVFRDGAGFDFTEGLRVLFGP